LKCRVLSRHETMAWHLVGAERTPRRQVAKDQQDALSHNNRAEQYWPSPIVGLIGGGFLDTALHLASYALSQRERG
jgi:hypothetical protein